jgi:hypothetical protein
MHAMAETLLSISEVLLFGRVVEDLRTGSVDETLQANAATTANLAAGAFQGLGPIDTVALAAGDHVLVRSQNNNINNGLYSVGLDANNLWTQQKLPKGTTVFVRPGGNTHANTFWEQKMPLASGRQRFDAIARRRPGRRLGQNKQLEEQLGDDSRLARIYGFSYEGTYYELPNPTLFLVHGEGESATDDNRPSGVRAHASRAPSDPSVSGVAAADFQFADDIMVWAYDKADYTIRMDVVTGMFEQVLLDIYFGFDSPGISGAKVSGAKVSGAKVSGAKVSGAKVSGAKVSGAKARGPSD